MSGRVIYAGANGLLDIAAELPGIRNAWRPENLPLSLESEWLPGVMAVPGDGQTWRKGSHNYANREYELRFYLQQIGMGLEQGGNLDGLQLLDFAVEIFLDRIATTLPLENLPYRITIDRPDGNAVRDSGLMPRLPNVPPLMHGYQEFFGFLLTISTSAVWPLGANE